MKFVSFLKELFFGKTPAKEVKPEIKRVVSSAKEAIVDTKKVEAKGVETLKEVVEQAPKKRRNYKPRNSNKKNQVDSPKAEVSASDKPKKRNYNKRKKSE